MRLLCKDLAIETLIQLFKCVTHRTQTDTVVMWSLILEFELYYKMLYTKQILIEISSSLTACFKSYLSIS